jgi:hypothetical protein
MNLKIKVGLAMLVVSWILVIALFFHGMFNPTHIVAIRINAHFEMYVELIIIFLSFIFVPLFIKELYDKRVISILGYKKEVNKNEKSEFEKTY